VAQVLALSGQIPHTLDSIPPAAQAPQPVPAFRPVEVPADAGRTTEDHATAPAVPAEAARQSLAESLGPTGDTQVRALATGTPDRGEVAFALQVKAILPPEETVPHASPAGLPAAEKVPGTPMPPPQGGVPAPDRAAASEKYLSQAGEPDHAPARAGREHRPEAAPAEHAAFSAGAAAAKVIPQASPDGQVRAETAAERPDSAAAKPVRPQDAMESETPPEAAKAPLVRDLKLEVTGGEQRVEIRVSERGGDVKMTVRTPDSQLAGTLRENLPALSARLADSGFRSDAWHPAASATNQWRHAGEASAGGASPDANTPSRQQNRQAQDDAGQRRPKSPQEATPQKEKGKDFAWLMSSLR